MNQVIQPRPDGRNPRIETSEDQPGGDRFFASIPKGRNEHLRIALSRFKGQTFLAIRIWFDDEGVLKPSSKGVNVKLEHLPDIADGINKALEAARADGSLS
ncbi:MAG: Transcriptional Coactivator p15 [Bradyrhizobium sp.]|jgi:hypothetical protein|nr:Transcriptional Coactivator p15 [Bradyrhizobium sp.]